MTEADRVRFLRAVHAVSAAGLLIMVRTGNRLRHVMPTEAGEAAAEAIGATATEKIV